MVSASSRSGVASHPSEKDLITSFLRPRLVSGENSSREFIHDADVYSAHPADLTGEHAPAVTGDGEEAWYFFTATRAMGAGGVRMSRTVDTGEGCWHSETGVKPVAGGAVGGHRQSFSFITKVGGGRLVRSGWLMVALGLDDDDKLTLCKVYFSPRAGKKKQPAAGRKRKATGRSPATPARRRRRVSEADDDDDDDDETTGEPRGAEKPDAAVDGGEVDNPPVTFASLLWDDKEDAIAMDDALKSFSWSPPCNQRRVTMTELLNMSDQQFDRDHPPPPAPAPVVRRRDKVVDGAAVCMWMTLEELYDHPDAKEIRSPVHLLEEMRSPAVGTKQYV